jgi:hypothetical protein
LFTFSKSNKYGVLIILMENCEISKSLVASVYRLFLKNTSSHNFFIYYPISMNKKKTKIWFFMRYEAAIKYIFLALFLIAVDSQLFFLNEHM